MKVRTTAPLSNEHGPIPIGTIIDDPESYQLVRLGKAEPADDEAAEVDRFDRVMAERQKNVERAKRAERTRLALERERENFCRKLGIDPAMAKMPPLADEVAPVETEPTATLPVAVEIEATPAEA